MHISLVRTELLPDRTLGTLMVDGTFECFTLEDAVREPGVKIPGNTAIPLGDYEVTFTWSPHFQQTMPLINHVPGFEGIRIHPGNSPADTEGCVLVGTGFSADRVDLTGSRDAYTILEGKIFRAHEAQEPITISITQAI